jgi:pimeloyl-ACP methyl ester carboxylesterase
MSRIAIVATALLLISCREEPTAPKRGEDGLFASVIPCSEQFIPEPDCQDPGPPSGGGINPNDTYVSANVVQSFTTSIVDDATGAIHTLQSDPVPFVLEAGFSPSTGADVVQHVYSDLTDDDRLRVVRIDGNTAVELSADGTPAPAAPGDLDGEVMNPLAGVPDLGMFPSVIDAIVGGQTGSFRIGALADQLAGVSASVVQFAGGVSARLVSENRLELRLASSPSPRSSAGGIEIAYDRRQRAEPWVVRQIDQITDVSEGGKRASIRSRLQFKGMRVARNPDADRRRNELRAKRYRSMRDATDVTTAIAAPQRVPEVALSTTPPDSWSSTGIVHWNPPLSLPYPEVPPNLPAPGLDPDFDKTEEEKAGCDNAAFAAQSALPVGGGQKVIFQHGFASGACTWKYQLPFLASYGAGGRVIGSTDALAQYEQQASTLRQQIPSGTNGWVLVGHSNGGIISRYLAQTQPSGFAKAVITINSPHRGARIVNKVAGVINDLQWLNVAAGTIYGRRSAGATSMAAIVSPNSILRKIWYGGIVVQQMAEGSAFLGELATRQESGFRRYAIRSQVHSEWQSVRVFCDLRASTSPGVPAGRRCVEDTKRYVKRTGIKAGILILLAAASFFVPEVSFLTPTLTYHAKTFATVVTLMYAVDWAWREAFSGYSPSDGVVPMSSQLWQGANSERVITGADSHVGSTKSALVRIQLGSLLQEANQ